MRNVEVADHEDEHLDEQKAEGVDHVCGEQERGLGNEHGLGWVVTMRGANSALLRGDLRATNQTGGDGQ